MIPCQRKSSPQAHNLRWGPEELPRLFYYSRSVPLNPVRIVEAGLRRFGAQALLRVLVCLNSEVCVSSHVVRG